MRMYAKYENLPVYYMHIVGCVLFFFNFWTRGLRPCQRSQLYGDEREREWVDTGRDERGPGGCRLRMLEVALGAAPAAVFCGKSSSERPQLQRLNLHF